MRILIATVASLLICLTPARAIDPKEVFLVVNKNLPASKEVAAHYCTMRKVPAENCIALDLPDTEDISRSDFNARLLLPLRAALKERREQVKVLLSVYGVPLRVGGLSPSEEESAILKVLEPELKDKKEEVEVIELQVKMLDSLYKSKPEEKVANWLQSTRKTLAEKQAELGRLVARRITLNHEESNACVDSELMLIWWEKYDLTRWQVNLLYWQLPARFREGKPPIVMTSRLDGPTPQIARGLVDAAVAAEKKGLDGKVYVDARGIRYEPGKDDDNLLPGYDESMREMAALLEKQGKMTVVLDNQDAVFKPYSCPDCALYCGWYSLANFVDSFSFVPGAVAWHLASFEAVSLRQPDAKYWCKNLLEKGVAATLGPVAEPYTIGFPKPEEFFGFLATGEYTLVEAYSRTIVTCSWMTVLIGDPLYNPFAKNPRLKVDQVRSSPVGGKLFFQPR